jgi:hypothetical protein
VFIPRTQAVAPDHPKEKEEPKGNPKVENNTDATAVAKSAKSNKKKFSKRSKPSQNEINMLREKLDMLMSQAEQKK